MHWQADGLLAGATSHTHTAGPGIRFSARGKGWPRESAPEQHSKPADGAIENRV